MIGEQLQQHRVGDLAVEDDHGLDALPPNQKPPLGVARSGGFLVEDTLADLLGQWITRSDDLSLVIWSFSSSFLRLSSASFRPSVDGCAIASWISRSRD
jgi:hypothetical protein